MREIKFRAWDREKKQMTFPVVQCSFNSGCYDINSLFAEHSKDFEWMQYTGLKDKQGKEIYEGDILRPSEKNYVDKVGEVRAEPGGFQIFTRRPWPDWFQDFPMRSTRFNEMGYEIIGNIYEHPHLLIDPDLKSNES